MKKKSNSYLSIVLAVFLMVLMGCIKSFCQNDISNDSRIKPYVNNSMFWQFKQKPIYLLGGSSNDNIFQHAPDRLHEELDKLIENGGNYLRNTISSRDIGDIFPYRFDLETKKYDLTKWNDAYWEKLDHFLKATADREIIVQMEIWDTYDFYTRSTHLIDGVTAWGRNPFNPANNINYGEYESGLYANFQSNGQALINPFFNTTLPLKYPFDFSLKHLVLGHQQAFVDKILSISLNYDHVLYVIDNETCADPKWSIYWAQYIRKKANDKNKRIEITEMFDSFDPTSGAVPEALVQNPANHFFTLRSNTSITLNDPVNYSYIDISNNNAQKGETHYKTTHYIWEKVAGSKHPRPINNTKIYGSNTETWTGSETEGLERFCRNVFAGCASVRFHRPNAGIGNSDVALSFIKSMNMLIESVDFFSTKPSNHMLQERSANEAFCLSNKSGQYLLFFPSKASVTLNIKKGKYDVKWLNPRTSTWLETQTVTFPGKIETPDDGFWLVSIQKSK